MTTKTKTTKRHAEKRVYQLPRGGEPARIVSELPVTFVPRKLRAPLAQCRVFGFDTESHKRESRGGALRTSTVQLAFHDSILVIDLRSDDPAKHLFKWLDAETGKLLRPAEPAPKGTAPEELRGAELMLHALFMREDPCDACTGKPVADKPATKRAAKCKACDGSGVIPWAPRETHARAAALRPIRPGEKYRDGRHQTVRPVLGLAHNLEYDVCRLFPLREWMQAVQSGAPFFKLIGERYEVQSDFCALRGASQFHWYIRDRETGRILRIKGLDTFNYWKTSLDSASKSLGGAGKVAIDKEDFGRSAESFTDEEWRAFTEGYAARDPALTRHVYLETVAMLVELEPLVINRDGLIPPSAPAVAAAVMFQKAFTLHKGLKEWTREPAWSDAMGCDGYHGARVFSFPGVYRDLVPDDLKSAYGYAMAILPDPVTAKYHAVEPCAVTDQAAFVTEYAGRFGVLYVSGAALDAVYPAFPQRNPDGTMRWLCAERFERLAVTIPELVIGVARGALRIDEIHDGCLIEGDSKRSFLRHFILDMYAIKEANKTAKPALSAVAKLLGVASYGKLIEVVESSHTWSGVEFPQPVFQKPTAEESHTTCHCCEEQRALFTRSMLAILASDDEVDTEALYFGPRHTAGFVTEKDEARLNPRRVKKVRRVVPATRVDRGGCRLTKERARGDVQTSEERRHADALRYANALCDSFYRGGDVEIDSFLAAHKSFRAGSYFLPLYAAQITGFITAIQGLRAASLGAVGGDTDSVFIRCPDGDPDALPGADDYFATMKRAGYPAPRKGGESIIGLDRKPTTLGQWVAEAPPCTDGILVARKVYSLAYPNPPAGHPCHKSKVAVGALLFKQAHHAMPAVPKETLGAELHALMHTLYTSAEASPDGSGEVEYFPKQTAVTSRLSLITGKTPGLFDVPRHERDDEERGEKKGEPKRIKVRREPVPHTSRDRFGIVRWNRAQLVRMIDHVDSEGNRTGMRVCQWVEFAPADLASEAAAVDAMLPFDAPDRYGLSPLHARHHALVTELRARVGDAQAYALLDQATALLATVRASQRTTESVSHPGARSLLGCA